MVAGILGWRRLLCKNVVFLLKTVLLAGWEFALRMIPAGILRLVPVSTQPSLKSWRGCCEECPQAFSKPHPVMSRTAVHLLDRILRPHGRAPCTTPSNP